MGDLCNVRSLDSVRTSIKWDRESFVRALVERQGPEAATVATGMLDWAASHCPHLWWGEGSKNGSCFLGITHEDVNYYPLAMWTTGLIELQFYRLNRRSVPQELRESLASKLNAIPGIVIPPDALTRLPSFDMSLLKERSALTQFFDAIEWFVAQIKTASKP